MLHAETTRLSAFPPMLGPAPGARVPRAAIRAAAVHIPADRITNEELVASFNAYVVRENLRRAAAGEPLLEPSSASFIEEASGIRARHVLDKTGILDPERMVPALAERPVDALSIQAEFALESARPAVEESGIAPGEIDLVICACSHHQRPYPAIAIEVQAALGAAGAAFDMNVACSSATFGLHLAHRMVAAGAARNVLVVSPEIMSGHLNFRDRKTHFIFGDASTSVIVGAPADARRNGGANGPCAAGRSAPTYEILDSRVWTGFSSNIRSDFGFLNRTAPETAGSDDKLVTQVGNRVFKDIVPAASRFLKDMLDRNDLTTEDVSRFWLHQANLKLNKAIVRQVLGHEDMARAPAVLGEIGNVASPGSIVAFHRTREEVPVGGLGLICSFGGGYSMGCLLMRRLA